MTGDRLHALVLAELRRARLQLRCEMKRNVIGLFVLLWSDFVVEVGIGNRVVHGRDPDVRRREASIAVLTMHSRVPRISYGGSDGEPPTDLWVPPRCPEPILRALVAHAIAQTAPTRQRQREVRRRLREAGVRLSDFAIKPSYARRSAS
jgi:hypothetical protein